MAYVYYDVGKLGGAEFYMSRHSHQGSHRVAVHKYPESSRVDYVWQGLDEFKFTISAYVVGGRLGADDYDIQRDKLWNVLRKGGSTTLLHPYLGLKQVHIRSFSFNETEADGNIAQFRMTLSEIAPQAVKVRAGYKAPNMNFVVFNAQSYVFQDIKLAFQVAQERQRNPLAFVDKIFGALAGSAPVRWLQTGAGALRLAGDVLAQAIAVVQAAQYQTRGLLEYKRQLSRIYSLKDTLLVNVAELYDEMLALFVIGYNPYGQFTPQSFSRFTELLKISNFNAFDRNALRNIFHAEDQESIDAQQTLNTFNTAKYGDYNTALTSPSYIITMAAFLEMCKQAGTMVFKDVSQLDYVEEETLIAIDNRLSDEEISTSFRRSLMQVKAGCVAHFRQQRGIVGRTEPITPQSTTNAFLFSYTHAGSVAYSDTIVLQNLIENPFFIEAGNTINVARR